MTARSNPTMPANPLRKREAKSGFTLIELLVGLTIMGLMAGIVVGAFHLGMRAYERGEEIGSSAQEEVYGWGQMAHQIRSAMPYKYEQKIYLEGESDSLDFVSAYSLRWGGRKGLVRVSYRIRETSDDRYEISVFETLLLDEDVFEESIDDDDYEPLLLLDQEPRFNYFREAAGRKDPTEGKWVESWDKKDGFPGKIAIVIGDADPEEDVAGTLCMALLAEDRSSSKKQTPVKHSSRL